MALNPLLLGIEEDIEKDLEEQASAALSNLEKENSDISAVETDSDFGDLLAADDDSVNLSINISEEVDADLALEAIASYLKTSLSENSLNKCTINMANVAIESICNKANFKSEKVAFSMEAFEHNPMSAVNVALEDIKERAVALWQSVKDKIAILAKFLGEKMNFFKRNISKMKARISVLETELSLVKSDAQAKAKYFKPQNWFIDLMYSKNGMPDGLEGIGKAVEGLLRDHRQMANDSISKYTKWLLSNYKEAERDSKVFNSLKVNTDEFLLSGATEFNRSIGTVRPVGDNMFYRGKELPGNKAFFTSVKPKDKVGISAIGTLSDVSFSINYFDPTSYKLDRIRIAEISLLSSGVWLAAAIATMGLSGGASVAFSAASIGSGLYSIYNSLNSKVKDTGNRVHLSKDMIFKALTINELKKTISDLKNGVKALQDWYADIFEHNWKQAELDRIINNVTGIDRVEVNNNSSFRALKRYCVALLNLMNSTTVGTHVYAFKTYFAMLNYAEKSIRQYK